MKANSMPRESGHNELFRVWTVPFKDRRTVPAIG
jgi:hypothetical protein